MTLMLVLAGKLSILPKKHDSLGPRDWLITILKTRNPNISFCKTWLQARGMVLDTQVLQLNVNRKTGSKEVMFSFKDQSSLSCSTIKILHRLMTPKHQHDNFYCISFFPLFLLTHESNLGHINNNLNCSDFSSWIAQHIKSPPEISPPSISGCNWRFSYVLQ